MRSAIHSRLVAAGVEEEFHIVDLATRRLTGQADRLMGQLPAGRFSWEMQRSVVEANSRPWAGLAELAEDIAGLRQAAIAAAEPSGWASWPPGRCRWPTPARSRSLPIRGMSTSGASTGCWSVSS